jgi:Ca2+-binding RTX toxin-like protein
MTSNTTSHQWLTDTTELGAIGSIASSDAGVFREGVTLTAFVVTGDPNGDRRTDIVASSSYSYQWYKDGNIIDGATTSTYAVPASGAGTYKVAITYTDAEGFTATVDSPDQVIELHLIGLILISDQVILWVKDPKGVIQIPIPTPDPRRRLGLLIPHHHPVTPGNPAHSPESTVMTRTTGKTSFIKIYTTLSRGKLELRQIIFISKKRDKISGTDQGEIIAGGGGKNRLTGGGGPDAFLFQTPDGFGRKTADRITDFNSEEGDRIAISRDAFEDVDRVRFKVVSGRREAREAGRSNKNFVYDDKNGMLYYDANGKEKGWGDGGAFAKLLGVPDVERSDFIIL